ncbi:hypothetical protein [Patiriisocius marinus]|uniref:Uncharacterized protein n=1 Tax=Patiriisocius marinus TaxID=1397112 RepID=A0A5J4IUY4_9FLAO|nr:hypothetical protein [Patiriisocius marinus]GER58002.1 hypothetical protein ULMA_01100 [Patiriisocius marinus]
MSCKTVQIDTVHKQIITPGRPSGVIYIKYIARLSTSEKIKIDKIVFENALDESLKFHSVNLDSAISLTSAVSLDVGKYQIEITTPYNEFLKSSSEILMFYITRENEEPIILKKKSQRIETLRMK